MSHEILSFKNMGNKTVYNPTVPFRQNDKEYIGIRTESLDSELDSEVRFAYRKGKYWVTDDSLPTFQLQDPALTTIENNMLLAGVYTEEAAVGLRWRTDFYFGPDISRLEKISSGPWSMKDIRLIDLGNRIGVFTRPQGNIGGKGKIGYLEISSLNELNEFSEEDWYSAELFENLFNENEWGGVNQVVKLSDDLIGIIGHVAHQTCDNEEPQKHYYAMSFTFDTNTREYSNYKIIAKRNDFPPSPSKRSPEYDDILFPAGIVNLKESHVDLCAGLSDFCCGKRTIPNPFLDTT